MHDFGVQFPEVDSESLFQKWPVLGSQMENVLETSYDMSVSIDWPEEIAQVLALIKLFPAKSGRYAKSTVVPFAKAIDKLIVHCPVRNTLNLLHILIVINANFYLFQFDRRRYHFKAI